MRLDDIDINMDPVHDDNIVEPETVSEMIEKINEINAHQNDKYREEEDESSCDLVKVNNNKIV